MISYSFELLHNQLARPIHRPNKKRTIALNGRMVNKNVIIAIAPKRTMRTRPRRCEALVGEGRGGDKAKRSSQADHNR